MTSKANFKKSKSRSVKRRNDDLLHGKTNMPNRITINTTKTTISSKLVMLCAIFVVLVGILLTLCFDGDKTSAMESTLMEESPLSLTTEYLKEFRGVYGKFGLRRPDFIEEGLDIDVLRQQLSQDTPIYYYYGMDKLHEVTTNSTIRSLWDSAFSHNMTEPDLTDAVIASLLTSVRLEGETDIKGQQRAFIEAYYSFEQEGKLSVLAIQRVHAALMQGTFETPQTIPGQLRSVHTYIGGSLTATIFEIQASLQKLVDSFNDHCLPLSSRSIEYASCSINWYLNYERIHPFYDGNGRTGRAWLDTMLLHKQLPPTDLSHFVGRPHDYHTLFKQSDDRPFHIAHLDAILRNGDH